MIEASGPIIDVMTDSQAEISIDDMVELGHLLDLDTDFGSVLPDNTDTASNSSSNSATLSDELLASSTSTDTIFIQGEFPKRHKVEMDSTLPSAMLNQGLIRVFVHSIYANPEKEAPEQLESDPSSSVGQLAEQLAR